MDKKQFYEEIKNLRVVQDIDREFWPLFEEQLIPLKPKIILEIGIECGNSGFMFSKVCTGMYIGIDIGFGNLHSNLILEANIPVCLIKGDSTKQETIDKLKFVLYDSQIDALYIDGSHELNDVYQDLKNYVPFVRKGGLIAAHDYGVTYQAFDSAKKDNIIQFSQEGIYRGEMGTYWFIKA